ncbi:MAG: sugar nucleotide-binding protein [Opitutaceae bacterium]|nr:sugar nucleotide-binding protein [Opitutaceae bacterium]
MHEDTGIPFCHPLELWGGVECSFTRVEHGIVDQQSLLGHDQRPEDLDRFARLGLKALRFPILWERHSTEEAWAATAARLQRLRDLGIRPIAGLVHHGSGPTGLGLLDPEFPARLATFASEVARRFPWIDAYTPINEPLTTARFAGLYGLWHPFGRSTACFGQIFINECEGIRRAMAAIRRIVPHAQLVQTEDIGRTYSTPLLAYQATLENERRFLTFDTLSGRLVPASVGWDYLLRHGVKRAALASFLEDPCPPDVYGVNYYVTSERFLDHRLDRYPPECHGGNERHAYADITAVRVRAEGIEGHEFILREVWERYRGPMALTEVQLACTREEQMRWTLEAWDACRRLRQEGVDLRAMTAWALLGSYDWDSLLVERSHHYENGAFDVRGPAPRETAVGKVLAALAGGQRPQHPVLSSAGWWRRDIRLEYPPVSSAGPSLKRRGEIRETNVPPLLILGAQGTLARAFERVCRLRGIPAICLGRASLDLCDGQAVARTVKELAPWAAINTSGYVRVDDAEDDHVACHAINVRGASHLAASCAEFGIPLVSFSSDLVFGGEKGSAYVESDATCALNIYGRSKIEMESRVQRLHPETLIIRTSAFFGPWDEANFVHFILRRLSEGGELAVASDLVVSPTYVPDLVHATLDLLIDGERGIWHVANGGSVTWADLALRAAELAGLPTDALVPVPSETFGFRAQRPRYSALASERGQLLRSWEDALERFFEELESSPVRTR